ncbi:MAG: hypothetical protein ABIH23_26715 [bacterium]
MNHNQPFIQSKRLFILIAIPLVCLSVYGQDDAVNSSPAFESFSIVLDRNIFNPNRYPRREAETPALPPPRPPEIEHVSLIGTIIYSEGAVAFFEGTRSESAVRLEGEIAGYRITKIGTDKVKLEKDDQSVDLPVGMGLSRQDEGEWEVSSTSFSSNRRESSVPAGDRSGSASSSGSESDKQEPSDVLKKLIERRKQETQP